MDNCQDINSKHIDQTISPPCIPQRQETVPPIQSPGGRFYPVLSEPIESFPNSPHIKPINCPDLNDELPAFNLDDPIEPSRVD